MIYTEMTQKAMKLCFQAHKNQVDKSGIPYVFHPFHVAESMLDEVSTTVALLHDVVEDTPYTLDDLRAMGFPPEVTDVLALLTHDESVPYMDYVRALSTNPVARLVKLSDLAHNSDRARLKTWDEAAAARLEKYRAAAEILWAAEYGEEMDAAPATAGNESAPDAPAASSYRPHYDRLARTWRVSFPDRPSEEGDLPYVASEFARTGLYFPYNDSSSRTRGYHGHDHSFEGVLRALLDDPDGLSIDGYEDYYSAQEREMLDAVQEQLLQMRKCPAQTQDFPSQP